MRLLKWCFIMVLSFGEAAGTHTNLRKRHLSNDDIFILENILRHSRRKHRRHSHRKHSHRKHSRQPQNNQPEESHFDNTPERNFPMFGELGRGDGASFAGVSNPVPNWKMSFNPVGTKDKTKWHKLIKQKI